MNQRQLTHDQQRQAKRLQLQHQASEARKQRHEQALEQQSASKQGQKVWIIPAFDADRDESQYLIHAVREALPEYHCQLAHAPEVTDAAIYELMHANTTVEGETDG